MKDLMKFLRRIGVLPKLTTFGASKGILQTIEALELTAEESSEDANANEEAARAAAQAALAFSAEAAQSEKVAKKLRDLVSV